MAYSRDYNARINWENFPSTNTAVDADNLNKMDYAIFEHDKKIVELDGRLLAKDEEFNNVKAEAQEYADLSEDYALESKSYSEQSLDYANQSKSYIDDSKAEADRAYSEAERARLYADTVQEGITTTTSRELADSEPGGIRIISMDGESQQNGTPTPEAPIDIDSVEISEIWSRGRNIRKYNDTTLVAGESDNFKFYNLDLNGAVEKNKTYTFSFYTDYLNTITVSVFNSSLSVAGFDSLSAPVNGRLTIKFTTRDDLTNFNRLLIYAGAAGSTAGKTVKIWDIQLEENTVATEFQPYTEKRETLSAPIVLRGIGDVKDVLCKKNGVFGVLRKFSTITFNGTEAWVRGKANESDRYSCVLEVDKGQAQIGLDEVPIGYCTHFEKATRKNSYVYATDNRYSVYTNTFRISYNTATTLDEFKTWLASNNVTIDFMLATPTFEPLPLADQIVLHRLKTFKGVTYLYTNSTIIPIIEWEGGTSVVGGYALEGLNSAEANRLELEQLKTLTNELATQIVAGSEA